MLQFKVFRERHHTAHHCRPHDLIIDQIVHQAQSHSELPNRHIVNFGQLIIASHRQADYFSLQRSRSTGIRLLLKSQTLFIVCFDIRINPGIILIISGILIHNDFLQFIEHLRRNWFFVHQKRKMLFISFDNLNHLRILRLVFIATLVADKFWFFKFLTFFGRVSHQILDFFQKSRENVTMIFNHIAALFTLKPVFEMKNHLNQQIQPKRPHRSFGFVIELRHQVIQIRHPDPFWSLVFVQS